MRFPQVVDASHQDRGGLKCSASVAVLERSNGKSEVVSSHLSTDSLQDGIRHKVTNERNHRH